ncbi:hypothetical protein BJY04DRAFT_227866 [Aspergillus karnatakaensis]|uniref:uncharacterized protein n=1 Tax=Aspergillus karnatakaensis TaxID=1810916 RepID=UPI003CCDCFA7
MQESRDIAIIGYAFKLPSGIEDDTSLWDVLQNRQNLKSSWPASRLGVPDLAGHYISEDVRCFDAPFFSVTPTEAASMDPLQRWTLEVSYRALETAGIPVEKIAGSRTAVFSASMIEDFSRIKAMDPDNIERFAATGHAVPCIIPNRVSWYFDLRGPSIHVNTACSSSLSAVDMACKVLQSGDSDCAIVTGSNLLLDPAVFHMLSSQDFLSPDGLCYSFDHRANGYARGEGVLAVILKPVSAALRDGDTIRAVIRGTGSNQDGRTPVLTQPSLQSQVDLIRHVYRQADLALNETRYVEAHGTETPVGDPIEAEAIGRAFGKSRSPEEPLYVGSIKANVGHLEGASGLASLIKAIRTTLHSSSPFDPSPTGIIPPNALFEKINPAIEAERFNIAIPTQNVTWPGQGLRRVSVNSFGFGGSNSHLILDDALHYLQARGMAGNHCCKIETTTTFTVDEDPKTELNQSNNELSVATHINEKRKLLVWTAADENAINRLTKAYKSYYQNSVSSTPERVSRLAYTLSNRRGRMLWRSYAITREDGHIAPVTPVRSSTERGLAFVFTGQGAQHAEMGVELLHYPMFAHQIKHIDAIYKTLGCGWSVFDELRRPDHINKPQFSQALCTAVQIGLVHLLRSFGVVAKSVVGHSSGEIAAAYTSGALSLESACKVAYFRGQLAERVRFENVNSPGAMLSINLAEDQVSEYLQRIDKPGLCEAICIACVNSPSNCTLSGPEWAIDAVSAQAEKDGLYAQKLSTGVAYHSPYLQSISDEYVLLMGDLNRGQDRDTPVSMVSSVTGRPISPSTLLSAQYWAENLLSPVQFFNAVQGLGDRKQQTVDTFTDIVEIGPHPALRRPIRDTLAYLESGIRYHYTLHRSQSPTMRILDLAGRLFCLGYSVCISSVNQQHSPLPILVYCPPYPFDRSQFWSESRVSRNYRLRGKPIRDTLGARAADWNPLEPRWRNFFSLNSHPWIRDHQISDTFLFPAAGMLVVILEAAHQIVLKGKAAKGYLLKRVDFISPIIVPEAWTDRVETQVRFRRATDLVDLVPGGHGFDVSIFSYLRGVWTECCRAKIEVQYEETQTIDANSICNQHEHAIQLCKTGLDSREIYNDAVVHGLQYGDWFKLLQNVRSDGVRTAVSRVDVHEKHREGHFVHPAVLDQIFQVLRVAAGQLPAANIPVGMINAWFAASGWQETQEVQIAATAARLGDQPGEQGRISVLGKNRMVLCSVESAATATVSGGGGSKGAERQLLYSIEWQPQLSLLRPEQLQALFGGRISKDERGIVTDHAMLCDTLNIVTARTLSLLDRERVPTALRQHVDWMKRHVRKHVTVSQRQQAASISDQELENQLCKIDSVLPAWTLYTTCARKLPQILAGEVDPLQVVFESDQARIFYADLFQTLCADGRLASYLELAAHENPALRILEIGAGTGGMTGHVLAALQQREARTGGLAFASYTYTDISPAFFEQARHRWPELVAEHRLKFSVFDMGKPLASQDLLPGSYDIVIAGSVLHATPDLEATIRNVRTALTPGGHLILLEAVKPDSVATNFMAGLVPGWWGAREAWRGHSAAVGETVWDQCLRTNGFSGAELVLRDFAEEECHNMSIIITTAVVSAVAEAGTIRQGLKKPQVVVVIEEAQEQQELANVLCEQLACSGWLSMVVVFGPSIRQETWTSEAIVVCIAEVNNRPVVASLTEEGFTCLKHVTSHNQLLWVTASSLKDPQYPAYGQVHGLLRCIRAEQVDSHVVTLSIEGETTTISCARSIETVLEVTFLTQSKEVEYVVRDGHFVTGRAVKDIQGQTALQKSLAREPWAGGAPLDPVETDLRINQHASSCHQSEFESDRISIQVDATSDIAHSRDRATKVLVERPTLEGRAGRNTAQSSGSSSPRSEKVLLDHGVSAYHALVDIARVRSGDRVLIDHVFTSTGLMAAIIAQKCGADVFVTALLSVRHGEPPETLTVEEEHLLVKFVEKRLSESGMPQIAGDEKFHVVFSGFPSNDDQFLALVKLVAAGGHLIIARGVDTPPDGRTPFTPYYPRNISVSLIDLDILSPTIRAEKFELLRDLITEDISKLSSFIADTIWMPTEGSLVARDGPISRRTFPKEATYLIVGGSGGLGRAIIRWMAEHGAKHIILLSRSGASSGSVQAMLSNLRNRGVNITALACDASSESSLATALESCSQIMPPVRGCINAAMVLQDAVFQETMTFEQWTTTIRSKVQTSWNLHRLLSSDLDFFVLLSSLLGVTGQIASANYAAGCTFQDALAKYRVANGQPAISLDLGWMRDVGIIAETPAYQRQRHATDDMQPIDAKELLALLEICLLPDPSVGWNTAEKPAASQVLFGLRTPADILREGRRPPALFDQPLFSPFAHIPEATDSNRDTNGKAGGTEPEINAVLLFKQARDTKQRGHVVLRALAMRLARAIAISPEDVEPEKPLSSYGVDSLMAVELRNWIVRELEAPVSVFEIMGGVSIAGIADVVVQKSKMELV